ncbi:hypothetical protein [Thalassospira sp. ER-Se-21-Dark]|uniref:hypothetical protein n=1 Tax=Thalassospira sp. ER-Se-21-Dark TaxID=2585190 RepID=UPI001B30A4F3|nr:hypothetical protein [Thalassospira sp. ER-Se-21-Dark]MBP3127362.1 hypothetical protein [Thalassospira sp. ER-Se-21-Dark]
MAGNWEFNEADPSSVRVGVTQRDQFNNDDVGLTEALVREVIQNSSDAGVGETPVKVCFQLKNLDSVEKNELLSKFESLEPHLLACGLKLPRGSMDDVRVLVIEDYNTRGLTGSFESLDKDNFDSFWRAVGESEKKGGKGGRWGLGKLVYSSSSRVRSFFGLTVREGEEELSIMGQSVLANHNLGETYHPAHGFWFSSRSDNSLKLQLPVQDPVESEKFRTLFGVERKKQPGLSIVIPYLIDGITEDALIRAVLSNYYFPILAGRLEVEVGAKIIDAATFLDLVSEVQADSKKVPFQFIKDVSDKLAAEAEFSSSVSLRQSRLSEEQFSNDQISEMKSKFSAGKLVHACVPVSVSKINGDVQIGHLDLFLMGVTDEESPYSLCARGPITLPGEKSFVGAIARGAMVAHDDVLAEFLGDAENPAHTAWNSNAEKLNARWSKPRTTLTAVRHSLRDLYSLIAEQEEMEDSDALIDFFSLVDKGNAKKDKKKKVKKPKIDVPAREVAIRIVAAKGGFTIVSGPGALTWDYPRNIRVRLAYDIIGADPFRQHSPYDFDLNNKQQIELEYETGSIDIIKPNVFVYEVDDPEFRLEAKGFDTRRDLVVDARAV